MPAAVRASLSAREVNRPSFRAPAARRDPERVTPALLADVRRHGRFDAHCLNCGSCAVACELSDESITLPRRPIRAVLLGLKRSTRESLEPWVCHDCGDCAIACPQKANPAESMRTLRRYLTGQYDITGLSRRILRSRAWHLGALGVVFAIVLALLVVYHLHWGELTMTDFVSTALPMEHMFPKIRYFTWIVYGIPLVFLTLHALRMQRMTMGRSGVPLRHYAMEAWTIFVQVVTQKRMRQCPAEQRKLRALELFREEGREAGVRLVPRRWLKHWLMAAGTMAMIVITGLFLSWFQTDAVHAWYHPQRALGYLASACIVWATTDILVRRVRTPRAERRPNALAMPLLLWLTVVSGLAVHVVRMLGLELTTHYAYAVHLLITVPMLVVELPFGEWAHMIDRPLALYFHAVRLRAAAEPPAEAGFAPAHVL